MTDTIIHRAEKVMQRINQLAAISEDSHCITRTYGSAAFMQGRELVAKWMIEAGLEIRIDTIGNIRARLVSNNPGAKTLVIASHIDTVVNAGKFDGPLGVLMGLDLLEQLKFENAQLPFHIELISFCDEEGCSFHTTYLGSQVVAGCFDHAQLQTRDAAGICLQELIEQQGGNIDSITAEAISKDEWLGYYEIHIEQGPVLYERNIPVAVVTGIAGQRRVSITFKGEAGHAGTVPMKMRRDALACAAKFISAVEQFAMEHDVVATIGKIHVPNAASNVIPGEVITTLDVRSANESVLSDAYEQIKRLCEQISSNRNIELEWKIVQQSKPVDCDASLKLLLSDAIVESGYDCIELVSGAGHDAVPISTVAPVAMLFVRCYKGISHNPLENVELKDMAAAIEISDRFLKQLARVGRKDH